MEAVDYEADCVARPGHLFHLWPPSREASVAKRGLFYADEVQAHLDGGAPLRVEPINDPEAHAGDLIREARLRRAAYLQNRAVLRAVSRHPDPLPADGIRVDGWLGGVNPVAEKMMRRQHPAATLQTTDTGAWPIVGQFGASGTFPGMQTALMVEQMSRGRQAGESQVAQPVPLAARNALAYMIMAPTYKNNWLLRDRHARPLGVIVPDAGEDQRV